MLASACEMGLEGVMAKRLDSPYVGRRSDTWLKLKCQQQAAIFRGYPKIVRSDNGPEFTSRAFMGWALHHGIRHILIQPGRPMQTGYIESFNGRFRDECLNDHWFQTLHQARATILHGGATTTRSGLMA